MGRLDKPEVRVSLRCEVVRQAKVISAEEVGKLDSGEVVKFTITSQNVGKAAAINYETSGPLPAGTVFVPGSLQSDADMTALFSIDQGKTFAVQPMVPLRQPNGTIRQVPALPENYSHIRFICQSPLAPGTSRTVSFQVRVR
ncbi:MAG: hypothetical protein U0Y68_09755 [Blastocatellia bacterium]